MSLLLLLRPSAHVVAAPYFPDGLTASDTVVSGLAQTTGITGATVTVLLAGGVTSTKAIDSGLRGADLL